MFLHIQEYKVTILATADLHGGIPDQLVEYVQSEREKDKNLILVDAGDFFDHQNWPYSIPMAQWDRFNDQNHQRRMPPIIRKMGEMGYDAVVLGNHEFLSNDKNSLGEMILDFTDYDIPVLSANLYTVSPYTEEYTANYVNSFIVKEISTKQGLLRIGILGLTMKEVGDSPNHLELKDFPEYDGSLILKDLVEEAKHSIIGVIGNNADVIIAVVHSGEEPENPKHPGNRVKELAQTVNGIDAIVAAHTHIAISEHRYKNNAGKTVIVTQPGKHGENISKITILLTKENGKWVIKDKTSIIHKITE